ncbi:hypothetical protein GmHk_14G040485 [Glycine max]|nr:hypothetical protein GmHk_14G040485 [Glycine max]
MAQDMWGMKRWFFKRLRKQSLGTVKLLRSSIKGKKLYSPLSFKDCDFQDYVRCSVVGHAMVFSLGAGASHKTDKRLLLGGPRH